MEKGAGEIILYQPNETLAIEVKLDVDHNTVWLTKRQMADLFGRDRTTISRHITNTFQQGEVEPEVGCAFFAHTTRHGAMEGKTQTEDTLYYNLDVIISVGYRVKSPQGVSFRRWATNILKDYLIKGYSLNQQLLSIQRQIDSRFEDQSLRICQLESKQEKQQEQLDFFIRTSTPPAEMVFFNGEFFTARMAIENLIKTAQHRAIIIDHYIDARTFDLFEVRKPGVKGIIYTQGVGSGMTRLRDEYNLHTIKEPVEVFKWRVEPHDRFLVIDDRLYHCGHSLNATGSKLSAIMLMGTSPETILSEME